MGKHPSQSLVMGLQGKATEQKTGISLDYLTPGLLTPQKRIRIHYSQSQLSVSTAQAPSGTCWWLEPLARAGGDLQLLSLSSPTCCTSHSTSPWSTLPGFPDRETVLGPEKMAIEICAILLSSNQHLKANSLQKAVSLHQSFYR